MFGKLFGAFKNIGEKIRTGYNIGKKIFSAGKRLYNTFFGQPESPPKIDKNEERIKNAYSLEQRIIADKTPEISDDALQERLDRLLDIDRTNPSGFVLKPVPIAPDLISNNIFDIKPFRFPN